MCRADIQREKDMPEQNESSRLLVGVASKGDNQINEHFGHADAFHIYEVSACGVSFVETRLVEHYCQGGYGDEDKREAILRALADCRACFVARVGDGPRAKLAGAGVEAVSDYPYGAIDESLLAWFAASQVAS
jgi:nitrogen fixation protein NifB